MVVPTSWLPFQRLRLPLVPPLVLALVLVLVLVLAMVLAVEPVQTLVHRVASQLSKGSAEQVQVPVLVWLPLSTGWVAARLAAQALATQEKGTALVPEILSLTSMGLVLEIQRLLESPAVRE